MCGVGCAKCLLVLINVTFFLVGGALLAVGALAQFNDVILNQILDQVPDDVMDEITEVFDLDDFLQQAAIALMAAGGCIFVLGFLGCCGAIKQSTCLLVGYCTIVGILLAAEILGPILIYVFREKVEDSVKDELNVQLRKYDGPQGGMYVKGGSLVFGGTPEKLAWDALQVVVGCCGVEGPQDYHDYFNGGYDISSDGIEPGVSGDDAVVPLSCCSFITDFENDTSVGNGIDLQQSAEWCLYNAYSNVTHTQGCYDATLDMVTKYWYIALGIVIGVIFIEIVGLISACVIMRTNGGKEAV